MAKILLLVVIIAALSLQQSEASMKCYYCLDACDVSKAETKVCGQNIGPSQEAVCTTEMPRDSKTTNMAVRKCQIVNKGKDFDCPAGSECKTCRSELCNAAPSLGSNVAMVSVVAALFVTKFLLN